MKKVKRKRLYIVEIFEPMNNAPKVLSNEGKDISYRLGLEMGELWVSQGHEWGFISNRVEIRRKGMSRLFIAGRSEGYSKLREDIACISAPRTWTRVSRVETPLDFCWRWKRAPMSSEETKETRRKKNKLHIMKEKFYGGNVRLRL